jgi:hypothetical protein
MARAESREESGVPVQGNNNDRVRPFVIVGGRTRARYHLLVETLVSAVASESGTGGLSPEAAAVYEAARGRPSIAELSSQVGLPLGVVRVLLGDLAADELVIIHPTSSSLRNDLETLRRVRDGLRRLRV